MKLAMPAPDEIHLWTLDLDRSPAGAGEGTVLSEDEQLRAQGYRFENVRRRFVEGRSALRKILARYLSSDPGSLKFCYGRNGKPGLSGADLHFNFSNSGGVGVLAVARSEIGVDLEQLRPVESADVIVRSQFTPAERDAYFDLPLESRPEAFLRALTRKEAYLKAVGIGLLVPLNQVQVSLLPGDSTVHSELSGTLRAQELCVARGFVGAVATRAVSELTVRSWTGDSRD